MAAVHHEYAHILQDHDDFQGALLRYQKSLDLNPLEYKHYRCYGRCLYANAQKIQDPVVKKSTLNKATRLLEQSSSIGGEHKRQEISADLFLACEALSEIAGEQEST